MSSQTVNVEAYGTGTVFTIAKTGVPGKLGITIVMSRDDMDGPADQQKMFVPASAVLNFVAGIVRASLEE